MGIDQISFEPKYHFLDMIGQKVWRKISESGYAKYSSGHYIYYHKASFRLVIFVANYFEFNT